MYNENMATKNALFAYLEVQSATGFRATYQLRGDLLGLSDEQFGAVVRGYLEAARLKYKHGNNETDEYDAGPRGSENAQGA
jgi:hypothetical protein